MSDVGVIEHEDDPIGRALDEADMHGVDAADAIEEYATLTAHVEALEAHVEQLQAAVKAIGDAILLLDGYTTGDAVDARALLKTALKGQP